MPLRTASRAGGGDGRAPVGPKSRPVHVRAPASAGADGMADLALAWQRARVLLGDTRWASDLLAPLVAALADDPLVEPPLKVSREGGRLSAVLADLPAARITANVIDADGAGALPASIVASGQCVVTR